MANRGEVFGSITWVLICASTCTVGTSNGFEREFLMCFCERRDCFLPKWRENHLKSNIWMLLIELSWVELLWYICRSFSRVYLLSGAVYATRRCGGTRDAKKQKKRRTNWSGFRKASKREKKSSSVFPSRLKAGTLQCLPFPAVAPLFRATKASLTQVDHYFDIFSLLMNPWKRLPTSVEFYMSLKLIPSYREGICLLIPGLKHRHYLDEHNLIQCKVKAVRQFSRTMSENKSFPWLRRVFK